jgi:hypothetical protein
MTTIVKYRNGVVLVKLTSVCEASVVQLASLVVSNISSQLASSLSVQALAALEA